MSESATVLQPGEKVGDSYEAVKLIGRGGMGEVWAARHLRLVNKLVAVKVLHTKGSALTAEQLARFKREADVATRINHPNVVEVHDYNTLANGSPYLVLELLNGESLANRIRFGALSVDEATLVVRQVGSALDVSHSLNVVHRDLKPDNIFMVSTATGLSVKVLDFGISKVVDSTTLQTQEAVLVGTPQYMSPEQALGTNKDVGPQTDVFALGSIAYEMLSGQPAFAADSIAQVVFRIAYEKHRPLEQVKPGLPPRVYAAVERALEKDRTKRYPDVASFVADFSGQAFTRAPAPTSLNETRSPSGVAAPGMATPDSMAWGATAAQTPMPAPAPRVVAPSSPAVAVPPPLQVAPVAAAAPAAQLPVAEQGVSRRTRRRIVAAILVLVFTGAGRWLMQTLQMPPPPPVPQLPVIDTPVSLVKPGAGAAPAPKPVQPEPEPQPEVAPVAVDDAPVAAPVARSAARKKLSPEDEDVLRDMADKLEKKDAYERTRQRMKDLSSPEALSRGYALTTAAACSERNLASARSQFERVTERADKQEALVRCHKFGIDLQ